MNTILKYDAKLFEDKHKRFRLSTLYWVDNLNNKINYFDICEAFHSLCPHYCSIPFDKNETFFSKQIRNKQLERWCVENATGYWMNANFPERIASKVISNLNNDFWGFQEENDALIFKLTFC